MNGFEGGGGVPGRRRYDDDDDEGHEKEMFKEGDWILVLHISINVFSTSALFLFMIVFITSCS